MPQRSCHIGSGEYCEDDLRSYRKCRGYLSSRPLFIYWLLRATRLVALHLTWLNMVF